MENKENINVLIEKLRTHQPQLQNGSELTDTILKSIKPKPNKNTFRFLSFVQTFSSVAAVLLGILFIIQINYSPKQNMETVSLPKTDKTKKISPCLENLNEDKYNLIDVYICYLQQNAEKNKQLENLKNKYN